MSFLPLLGAVLLRRPVSVVLRAASRARLDVLVSLAAGDDYRPVLAAPWAIDLVLLQDSHRLGLRS